MKAQFLFLGFLFAVPSAYSTTFCHFADGGGTFASLTLEDTGGEQFITISKTTGDSFLTIVFSETNSGKVKVFPRQALPSIVYSSEGGGLSASLKNFVGADGNVAETIVSARFLDAATGSPDEVTGVFHCHSD